MIRRILLSAVVAFSVAACAIDDDRTGRTGQDSRISSWPEMPGKLVVVHKGSDDIHIIDLRNREKRTIVTAGRNSHEIAISPDGRTAVIGDYGEDGGVNPGNTLTVLDLVPPVEARTIVLGEFRAPHGVDFFDDERVLVTAELDQAALLVNVFSGEIETVMRTGQQLGHMAVTDGEYRAYVSNLRSANVSVFGLPDGELIGQVPVGYGPEGLAVSPDGAEVWVGNRGEDTISVIDTAAMAVTHTLEAGAFPARLAFTRDGARVLVSNVEDGSISVFDAETKENVKTIGLGIEQQGRVVKSLIVHPTAPYALIGNIAANEVIVIDLETLEPVGRIATDVLPDGIAISVRSSERR